jgi:hypothetical protein
VVLALPLISGLAQPLSLGAAAPPSSAAAAAAAAAKGSPVRAALAMGKAPLHVLSSLLLPRWLEAGESLGAEEGAFVVVVSGELTAALEAADEGGGAGAGTGTGAGGTLFTVGGGAVCFTEDAAALLAGPLRPEGGAADDGSWGGWMAAVGVGGGVGSSGGARRLRLTPTRRSLVLLVADAGALALIAQAVDRNIGAGCRGLWSGGLLPRLARIARLHGEYAQKGASAAAATAAGCLDALGADQLLALAAHLDAALASEVTAA